MGEDGADLVKALQPFADLVTEKIILEPREDLVSVLATGFLLMHHRLKNIQEALDDIKGTNEQK